MKFLLLLCLSTAALAVTPSTTTNVGDTYKYVGSINSKADNVGAKSQKHLKSPEGEKVILKKASGVPSYAVSMDPLVKYSKPDPLFSEEKAPVGKTKTGGHTRVKKENANLANVDYAQKLSPKTGYAYSYDESGPGTIHQQHPEYIEQSGYYNGHYEEPEPIIEIIIKESNESLPAPPPPPPPPKKKKKEPVQVFYVKYKKEPSSNYGEEKVVYEHPVPAITPPTNNDSGNDEEEEVEDYQHHHEEPVTLPPRPSTTLKAIIRPDSETYHGSGIHITFGGPKDEETDHDHDHHSHGGYKEQSAPQPSVALPPKSKIDSSLKSHADSQLKKRNPAPFQSPTPPSQQSFHNGPQFPGNGDFFRPTPSPQFQQSPRFSAQPHPFTVQFPGAQPSHPPPPPSLPQQQNSPRSNSAALRYSTLPQLPSFPKPQSTFTFPQGHPQQPIHQQPPQQPIHQQPPQQPPQPHQQSNLAQHVSHTQQLFSINQPHLKSSFQINSRSTPQPYHTISNRVTQHNFPVAQQPPSPNPSVSTFQQSPKPFSQQRPFPSSTHHFSQSPPNSFSRPTPSAFPPSTPNTFPQPTPSAFPQGGHSFPQSSFSHSQTTSGNGQRIQNAPQLTQQSISGHQHPFQQQFDQLNHQQQQQQLEQLNQQHRQQLEQLQQHQRQQQLEQLNQQQRQQFAQKLNQYQPQQQQQSQHQQLDNLNQLQIQRQLQSQQFSQLQKQHQAEQFNQLQRQQQAEQLSQLQRQQQAEQLSQLQRQQQAEQFQRQQQQQQLQQKQQQQQQQQQYTQSQQNQNYQKQNFKSQQSDPTYAPEIVKSISADFPLTGHRFDARPLIASTTRPQFNQHVQPARPQFVQNVQSTSRPQFVQNVQPTTRPQFVQNVQPTTRPQFIQNTQQNTQRYTVTKSTPAATTESYKKYTETTQPPFEYITLDPKKAEEEKRKKEERRKQNVAALPDEVPDDLRQQLLSSDILGNADIQILDYDKIGDIPIDKLPPEALANFQAVAGSNPVPSVVKPDSEDDVVAEGSEQHAVAVAPPGSVMEMKVVRYNPDSKEGAQIPSQYMKEGATQLEPVVLNDSRYNRYLPLKVAGAQFPVPDVPELRGKNVTSVVVLAPVDYEFLQRHEDKQEDARVGRASHPVLEVQGVHFITGDILKTLVKKPTLENYKLWLEKEKKTTVDKQSVVLLVIDSKNNATSQPKEIYMYDIGTQSVNKLSGELSAQFVEVAESNSENDDLEDISDSHDGSFTVKEASGVSGSQARKQRHTSTDLASEQAEKPDSR